MAFGTNLFILVRNIPVKIGWMGRYCLMASQTIFLSMTCSANRKLTTRFVSVIELPSSGMDVGEAYPAAIMARNTFLALMATIAHVPVGPSINTM